MLVITRKVGESIELRLAAGELLGYIHITQAIGQVKIALDFDRSVDIARKEGIIKPRDETKRIKSPQRHSQGY